VLNQTQKEVFEKWVIKNINENVVPIDEGNGGALVYNIVHLIRGDGKKYNYSREQDEEIKLWRRHRI